MSNFHGSPPVILKDCILGWADIFEPGEGMNGGKPKFKVTGLFPKDSPNYKIAATAMVAAAKGLWGDNAGNVIKSMAANSKALRDGDNKLADDGTIHPEYKGMYFVSASNKQDKRPQVVAQKKHNGKFVSITPDGRGLVDGIDVTDKLGYPITVPYRGCVVNLKVEFVAGKSFKGKNDEIIPNQVFGRIIAVQFVKDGTPFGPGATSAEGFDEVEVETASASSNDPFDDDIAF
jgi:hypothetical protein